MSYDISCDEHPCLEILHGRDTHFKMHGVDTNILQMYIYIYIYILAPCVYINYQ